MLARQVEGWGSAWRVAQGSGAGPRPVTTPARLVLHALKPLQCSGPACALLQGVLLEQATLRAGIYAHKWGRILRMQPCSTTTRCDAAPSTLPPPSRQGPARHPHCVQLGAGRLRGCLPAGAGAGCAGRDACGGGASRPVHLLHPHLLLLQGACTACCSLPARSAPPARWGPICLLAGQPPAPARGRSCATAVAWPHAAAGRLQGPQSHTVPRSVHSVCPPVLAFMPPAGGGAAGRGDAPVCRDAGGGAGAQHGWVGRGGVGDGVGRRGERVLRAPEAHEAAPAGLGGPGNGRASLRRANPLPTCSSPSPCALSPCCRSGGQRTAERVRSCGRCRRSGRGLQVGWSCTRGAAQVAH